MTREEAKELLPIIQAYAEGKTIECKCKSLLGSWIEAKSPSWSVKLEYRIKPEPKYRPFNTQEECWEEMHNHPDFGWIKSKTDGRKVFIGSISGESTSDNPYTMLTLAVVNYMEHSGKYIFEHYTFTDGSPFCIMEE